MRLASARILLVEDDQDINEIVSTKLSKEGYALDRAFSGTEALLLLDQAAGAGGTPYDVVVCDLMLPGLPGERVIERLRASGAPTRAIVVSARAAVDDRIDLLRLGADDYLVKPFDLDELAARVEVQLRHRAAAEGPAAEGRARRFGRWALDEEARVLAVDGEPVGLTRTEFGIVAALVRRPKKVFTKAELFEAVWGDPCPAGDNSTTVHVSNIRAKLRPSGTDGYIKTVWGLGFKLELPAEGPLEA